MVTDYKIMHVIISQVMFKNKTEVTWYMEFCRTSPTHVFGKKILCLQVMLVSDGF